MEHARNVESGDRVAEETQSYGEDAGAEEATL